MKVRGLRVLRGLSQPFVWELAATPMGSGLEVNPQTLQTPQGYSLADYQRDAGFDDLDAAPSTLPASHTRAREGEAGPTTCLCTRADYACSSPLCPGRRLLGEQGSGVSPAPIAAQSRGVADDVSLPRPRLPYGTYYEGGLAIARDQHRRAGLRSLPFPGSAAAVGPRGATSPRPHSSANGYEARLIVEVNTGESGREVPREA